MTFDVSVISREYKHRPAQVEVNGIYDGGVFRGYHDVSQNEINLVTDNKWNSFVYRGLEFDVTKRTERVQLIANYTRAWQHVAGTWQPNDPASFIQPRPFPTTAASARSRQRHRQLPVQPTRAIRCGKITRRALAPCTSHRGVWWSPQLLGAVRALLGPGRHANRGPDPRFGPSTVTLSNGRVVSNRWRPRFASPARIAATNRSKRRTSTS